MGIGNWELLELLGRTWGTEELRGTLWESLLLLPIALAFRVVVADVYGTKLMMLSTRR